MRKSGRKSRRRRTKSRVKAVAIETETVVGAGREIANVSEVGVATVGGKGIGIVPDAIETGAGIGTAASEAAVGRGIGRDAVSSCNLFISLVRLK